jgi:methionyl aminopeptidase
MIHIKSEDQIAKMRVGGKMLAKTLLAALKEIKPGVTELEIDTLAEKLILQKGGEPGFKRVKGYHNTICVATNEIVVHGIPTKRLFAEGDVVCIDCGVYYGGLHTDMAETILLQKAEREATGDLEKKRFLTVGKKALLEAIKVARAGNKVGHISETIQGIVEGAGYSVVRNLVGHGVGRELHEDPEVPGFLEGDKEKTPLLRVGMTIAIEVIYTMGKPDVEYASNDGWTIQTADKSISAVFERTVLITKDAPEVLTA